MALPAVIVGIAAAAAAAPEVISAIEKALIALGIQRSCVVEVVNTTNEQLKLTFTNHDSGAFGEAPPPWIEPRSTMVFSSHSTAAGRGAVGSLTLEGDRFALMMDWSNPFIGDNDLDASVSGARAAEFAAYTEAGSGDTNARLRCILSYTDQSRYISGPRSRLQSHNFPDRYIRHRNFLGELTPLDALDADFQFEFITRGPDLYGLRSVNFPSHYLRHQFFALTLQPPAGPADVLWARDTTFRLCPGLADPRESSFESTNYPGHYLRHRDFKLYLESGDTDLFKADATFRRVPA
jgi:hypothetical protein